MVQMDELYKSRAAGGGAGGIFDIGRGASMQGQQSQATTCRLSGSLASCANMTAVSVGANHDYHRASSRLI
jgi:hypothetical protein